MIPPVRRGFTRCDRSSSAFGDDSDRSGGHVSVAILNKFHAEPTIRHAGVLEGATHVWRQTPTYGAKHPRVAYHPDR